MFGQAMTGLMTILIYGDLPVNGGLWRPIDVDIGEPGTIVNAVPPAPVSNAHSEVGMRACKLSKDVLCQALALSDDPVLRGRIAGQHQDGFPGNALFGNNQHGGVSVVFYPDNAIGAGGGAQTIMDGQDAYGLTCTTGGGIPDIENHEGADPVLFLWRRLIPNSGGPGQMRGGQALDQAYAVHYTDPMAGPGFNACAQVPPHGVGGGYPANAGIFYPVRERTSTSCSTRGVLPTLERLEGENEDVRSKLGAHRTRPRRRLRRAQRRRRRARRSAPARPRTGRPRRRRELRRPPTTRGVYGVIVSDDHRSTRRRRRRSARRSGRPDRRRSGSDLTAPPTSASRSSGSTARGPAASCWSSAHADGNWRDGASLAKRRSPSATRSWR